jgi:hypothetical protein
MSEESGDMIMRTCVVLGVVLFVWSSMGVAADAGSGERPAGSIFARDNLVAWCIVPFDPANRTPEQRAEMLERLGIKRVAYDWREQHVPAFEEEILAYKKHKLEYFAFWGWHPAMEPLIRKHGIRPQIWSTFPAPTAATQEEKVSAAGAAILPLVNQTRELGCKLALYNHGGWAGEPVNMAAVCRWLRANAQAEHVGIVYNLHHGHDHISDFAEVLAMMKPYLWCLNLNGMNTDAKPKILPLGKGEHDRRMLEIIVKSGYAGPIGILDHREQVDTEQSLRENLEGLARLLHDIGDQQALKTFRK